MNQQINEILSKMTLEEKASLCSGADFWNTKKIERLGVPSANMADGPHGLRKENNEDKSVGIKLSFPATAFPPAVTLASSWDKKLAKEMGDALAQQCLDQNVSVLLGPGINIKRSPLCGRNFEYLSEDPYLSGQLSRNYVEGVQQNNVGTSLKHFCANNQEYVRQTINASIDERALREIYLTAFEETVKAQPWTIMCAYNRLNGTYLSDNKKILNDILREEWGYQGIVVSDWNATNNRVEGVKAGLDLEMPSSGGINDKLIVKAVKSGELNIEQLDKIATRMLEFIFKCEKNKQPNFKADYAKAHQTARKIAEQSMVLMKNDNNLLPLKESLDGLAVIGELGRNARYQGAGSSRINPYNLVSFCDALKQNGQDFEFASGYKSISIEKDESLYTQAIQLAKNSKNIILFVGLTDDFESEGFDRKHMCLPDVHIKLIEDVCSINPNTIVVLSGGSPVEMPWITKVNCLLNTYLSGEAGGEAIYNVLFGKVNPSGKLAETYPLALTDFIGSEYFPMGPKQVQYRESIYVGYRYFDTAKKAVRFPFGFGLSYTKFEYSDLKINNMQVSYTIKNIGEVAGAEISQLYIRDCSPIIFKADKELKGFEKTFLQPGESKNITHTLDYRSFAFFNTKTNKWYANDSKYEILIGASCQDIRLSQAIDMKFEMPKQDTFSYELECPTYYNIAQATNIPLQEFEVLFGDKVPENKPIVRGELDGNATISDLTCCIIGKIIMKVAPSIIRSSVKDIDITTMMMLEQGMKELPIRALSPITTGLVSPLIVKGLLLWANKKRFFGFWVLIGGAFGTLGNLIKKQINDCRAKRQEKKKLKYNKI